MEIIADKSGLLHYLKGTNVHPSRPFTESFLFSMRREYKKWCAFTGHGDKVGEDCYLLTQYQTGWVDYLKAFVTIAKYFTTDNVNMNYLEECVTNLGNPLLNSTKEKFKENLDELISEVSSREEEINRQLRKMTCLECERLGEAITCNSEGCFTASTVMAASAIEARLHELVKKKNRKLYNQCFRNQTLGALIKLFDKNEYKDKKFSGLKKIVPDRHKSLLDIVNTYRILSAHPLVPAIDHKISESVINLSFLFLLDPDLEIPNKKLLLHR
ncbi:MAG TPA: hypothetical protein VLX91_02030 [Candidatus Acidoferrales bacterium]|nr:hypothetical protein [Candidatus Acidoferrales bacterium]